MRYNESELAAMNERAAADRDARPEYDDNEYRTALVAYAQAVEAENDPRVTREQDRTLDDLINHWLVPVMISRSLLRRERDLNRVRSVIKSSYAVRRMRIGIVNHTYSGARAVDMDEALDRRDAWLSGEEMLDGTRIGVTTEW